jgi:hypothetical protein
MPAPVLGHPRGAEGTKRGRRGRQSSPASRGTCWEKKPATREKGIRPRRPGSIAITHVRRNREPAAPRSRRGSPLYSGCAPRLRSGHLLLAYHGERDEAGGDGKTGADEERPPETSTSAAAVGSAVRQSIGARCDAREEHGQPLGRPDLREGVQKARSQALRTFAYDRGPGGRRGATETQPMPRPEKTASTTTNARALSPETPELTSSRRLSSGAPRPSWPWPPGLRSGPEP